MVPLVVMMTVGGGRAGVGTDTVTSHTYSYDTVEDGDSRSTVKEVVLLELVGVMNASAGSESTITTHKYWPPSVLLSSGLKMRVEVKLVWFPD